MQAFSRPITLTDCYLSLIHRDVSLGLSLLETREGEVTNYTLSGRSPPSPIGLLIFKGGRNVTAFLDHPPWNRAELHRHQPTLSISSYRSSPVLFI